MSIESPELQLLFAIAHVIPNDEGDATIRQLLEQGIDWELFAKKVLDHGLTGLTEYTLRRVAPEAVPEDILSALNMAMDQTRRWNVAIFKELVRIIDAFSSSKIPVIPFKGPVLALESYGDLAFRKFGDLDFLIQDEDLDRAIWILHELGYKRVGNLSPTQFNLIHWLQGQEIIFRENGGNAVEPHTRLTPSKMAIDINYDGIWRRAQRTTLLGTSLLTLSPLDNLLALAIHGGKEMWWNIKWACDFAVFIESHRDIDWSAAMALAQEQGCLRMLLLATALVHKYFHISLPTEVVTAQQSDSTVAPMIGRILGKWHANELAGPPSNRVLSADRWRLHDGLVRKMRYVLRTLLLPSTHHIATISLPRALTFGYLPVKLVYDLVALPLWVVFLEIKNRTLQFEDVLIASSFPVALITASAERQREIKNKRSILTAAQRASSNDPKSSGAWANLGDALLGLRQHKKAVNCYNKALAIDPDNPAFWRKVQGAVKDIGGVFQLESHSEPMDATAWAKRAGRFHIEKKYMAAAEASDRALALEPSNVPAVRIGVHARLVACDWHKREQDQKSISSSIERGHRILTPLFHRAISGSEPEHLALSKIWGKSYMPLPTPLWRGERYKHDKIRIAYISTDFRDHVVSDVLVGCLEHHDRSKFVITGISLHPSDKSAMRQRIESSFDHFHDVEMMSNGAVASMLRELEIDITVDLNGNSGAKRIGIFSRRPAPIQVNYLGYPGTMGATYLDYILADRTVIPEAHKPYYTERVVYLPNSFFPCDDTRPIGAVPSRGEAGLPSTGFVFACHSAAHKIAPEMFRVWMRLLHKVEASVLWLKAMDPDAIANLWREATALGIAPERLIFAPRTPGTSEHLARLSLADLFLDTLPYNAHATTSDALWAGLPVITCLGEGFQGRVAASLLYAAGLPELVTNSLDEYEAIALRLAQNRDELLALRAKIQINRSKAALFNTSGYTRDLETAYVTMWERQQTGLSPEAFAVLRRISADTDSYRNV